MFVSSAIEVDLDRGGLREALADDARVHVVVGEALDVVFERVDAGGREDAGLAHRAAEHPAVAHERVDVLRAAGHHRAGRAAEPLGHARS